MKQIEKSDKSKDLDSMEQYVIDAILSKTPADTIKENLRKLIRDYETKHNIKPQNDKKTEEMNVGTINYFKKKIRDVSARIKLQKDCLEDERMTRIIINKLEERNRG